MMVEMISNLVGPCRIYAAHHVFKGRKPTVKDGEHHDLSSMYRGIAKKRQVKGLKNYGREQRLWVDQN